MEGSIRPHFFRGVATVVCKLLNVVQPHVAFFGQKDAQQCVVVKAMVRDLLMPVDIVVGKTLRDPDGLAMSSRNIYLSAKERAAAPALHMALAEAARRIREGDATEPTLASAHESVEKAGFVVDYFEARHAQTLARIVGRREGPLRLLAAARLGATRLIDNVAV